jgi:uncharacterized protein (TIGR00299 family) protein
MRILYYDCFSGISGDMNLGAMLDLGVSEDYLRSKLNKLGVTGWSLIVREDQRKGITGTRAIVALDGDSGHHHSHEAQSHVHGEHHDQHSHTHGENNGHEHHSHGEHHHRNMADIRKIIEDSSLDYKVKALSLEIFTEVAKAEGKIHGKPMEEVHFHEVGALDSIIDIVGAAICLHKLDVDRVLFSPLALGSGFVTCAHGKFPVPAPATTEILKGIPITRGDADKELTTPTGAAIAKVFADEFTRETNFIIQRVGYGIGGRDNPVPNVLRVYLAEAGEQSITGDRAVILESNIDDMNPEIYSYVTDKLMALGAMDVWITPIYMKKGRPANTLSVLCSTNLQHQLAAFILAETTTLGVRSHMVDKTMLERKTVSVTTPWGDVPVKQGILGGKVIKEKPEYEACRKLAEANNVPLTQVYQAIRGE